MRARRHADLTADANSGFPFSVWNTNMLLTLPSPRAFEDRPDMRRNLHGDPSAAALPRLGRLDDDFIVANILPAQEARIFCAERRLSGHWSRRSRT